MKNPVITVYKIPSLSDEEGQILSLVLGRESRLRASRPKSSKEKDMVSGSAYYVWRMAAFQISTNSRDWCMPMLADFEIPIRDYKERKEYCKKLDLLVDKICNTVPKNEWHGINRWSRALGYGV